MWRGLLLCGAFLLCSVVLSAEPVAVRYPEGLVHGFLVLHSLDGSKLADGDLIQSVSDTAVTSRVVFHFKDGSLHDETAVFSQRGRFHLIRDHLVQKGPAFPRPIDMSIDGTNGQVRVRYVDEHGNEKQRDQRVDLPPDLANGMIPTLLKNIRPQAPPSTLSLIVATPQPRLVRLKLSVAGRERFWTGTEGHAASDYVLKVEIGGIAGALAPLVGKQPPDSHVWILNGEAPAFVRADEPFYMGGPLWRIDLVSPAWRQPTAVSR